MMVLPLTHQRRLPGPRDGCETSPLNLPLVRQVREAAMNHNMVRNSVDESFSPHIPVCLRQSISNDKVISSDTLAGVLFFRREFQIDVRQKRESDCEACE